MRIVSNLTHSRFWSKMVNILNSKQDINLIPMMTCSLIIYLLVHKTPGLYNSYFGNTQYLAEGGKGGSLVVNYANKTRDQVVLYVWSYDQIPYYEAINIRYKGYNTPWCESGQLEEFQQLDVTMDDLQVWPIKKYHHFIFYEVSGVTHFECS